MLTSHLTSLIKVVSVHKWHNSEFIPFFVLRFELNPTIWGRKRYIKWTKNDIEDFYIVTKKIVFHINAVLLTFYSQMNPEKSCITVSTKILSSTTVFNIDNNKKCFLSSKSAY